MNTPPITSPHCEYNSKVSSDSHENQSETVESRVNRLAVERTYSPPGKKTTEPSKENSFDPRPASPTGQGQESSSVKENISSPPTQIKHATTFDKSINKLDKEFQNLEKKLLEETLLSFEETLDCLKKAPTPLTENTSRSSSRVTEKQAYSSPTPGNYTPLIGAYADSPSPNPTEMGKLSNKPSTNSLCSTQGSDSPAPQLKEIKRRQRSDSYACNPLTGKLSSNPSISSLSSFKESVSPSPLNEIKGRQRSISNNSNVAPYIPSENIRKVDAILNNIATTSSEGCLSTLGSKASLASEPALSKLQINISNQKTRELEETALKFAADLRKRSKEEAPALPAAALAANRKAIPPISPMSFSPPPPPAPPN